MKIGIVGLGSIGRRHASNLIQLGGHKIFALRSRKGVLNESVDFVEECFSWDEFLSLGLDAAIIANPTSLHLETMRKLEPANIPILVEKPLHSNADFQSSKAFQSNILVAYCLRFHPLYQYLKEVLTERKKELKEIYFERGYYLPKWHPYADYRLEYAARKDLGGGAVRTLSHELDIIVSWFSDLKLSNAIVEKRSELDIDVEDFATFEIICDSKIKARFQLDFINPEYTNKGYLQFEDEKWEFDFVKGQLTSSKDGELLLEFKSSELDSMYLKQMVDFLGFAQTGHSKNCSFEEGLRSIQLIDQIAAH